MKMLSLTSAVIAILAIAGGCRAQALASSEVGPSLKPSTQPGKGVSVSLRQVEITLLGTVSDVRGMPPWPDDDERSRSLSVEEPCELTLHLPCGSTLKIRTRPILIVSREGDKVVTVRVPVGARPAWMNEQAELIDRLLIDWNAVPNDRMKETIAQYKRQGPPSPADVESHSSGLERIGNARLDEATELLFELAGSKAKWSMTAVFSGITSSPVIEGGPK